jgi:uncharacterized protein (TIGR00251 family)
MKIDSYPDGILISAKVKPYSNHFKIKKGEKGLIIEVKSPPIKGKANKEIKEGIKKKWGKEVEILKGFKSHNKVILIKKANLEEIEKYFKS